MPLDLARSRFENDVKIYGIQTDSFMRMAFGGFENDVKIYGIQTAEMKSNGHIGLRMM